MSHPGGLEFAWVYAGGTVRQRGKVVVALGESASRVGVLVCQLPAQGGSPGGAVLNDRGELVGLLCAKESAQMVGYAVAAEEIAAFLDVTLHDRPASTLAGLLARIDDLPRRVAATAALAFARRAESLRSAGKTAEAIRDCRAAVALDASCVPARLCLAKMLEGADALAELDTAVERGPFDRGCCSGAGCRRREGLAQGTRRPRTHSGREPH